MDRCLNVRLTDSDHSLCVGSGDDLTFRLNSGDLCSLLFNGRRLPGLVEEGGLRAADGDLEVLREVFPDTGAARRSLDGY